MAKFKNNLSVGANYIRPDIPSMFYVILAIKNLHLSQLVIEFNFWVQIKTQGIIFILSTLQFLSHFPPLDQLQLVA